MRWVLTIALLTQAFLTGPAAALEGPWCAEDGSEMWIEAGVGLWFGEHTLCEADPAPRFDAGGRYAAAVACTTFRIGDFNGDGAMETHAVEMPEHTRIVITRPEPIRLIVELPPQAPFEMIHCHAVWPN